MEPYKDQGILYELYVKRRMSIKEMSDIFLKNYNCKVTPQSIYNWLEKYDMLKYRGKGRNINISRGTKTGPGKKTKPPWLR